LWFLHYLALITALALVLRSVSVLLGERGAVFVRGVDAACARLTGSWWRLPVLVAPTAVALWFMRQWGMDTPDQSLVPHLPVTLVYFGFFGFGWMLGRQPGLVAPLVRLSPAHWIAAFAGIVTTLAFAAVQGTPSHPRYDLAHAAFVAGYALMMWSLVFLTLGVFRRLCGGEPAGAADRAREPSRWRAATRYVADSSYWLYLAHLPVVVWLQVAFAEFALPWWAKLGAISAITLAVLLVSYDLFVRSTAIGRILNGRRRERVLFRTGAQRRAAAGVVA
jgi:peptidoglycan/LPS O-acetylase OafA/YrhL